MKRLLTAQEAGKLLQVNPSWLYQEVRAERIPHVRLGRYVRFEEEALEQWLQARARGPLRVASSDRAAPRRCGPWDERSDGTRVCRKCGDIETDLGHRRGPARA